MRKCCDCSNYGPNMPESGTRLCDADMYDEDPDMWFVERAPDHECHRPEDYEEA